MLDSPAADSSGDPAPERESDRRLSRPLLWGSLVLGALLSGIVCWQIATRSFVVGSVEGRWVYSYLRSLPDHTLAIAALACAVVSALLYVGSTTATRREWLMVLVWMAVALVVQAMLRSQAPFSFERIFTSDGANSFYWVTQHYDATTVLSDFDRARAHWPLHAQSNMPGKLMFLYALRGLSTQPAMLAWLVVLVSNLGGALMYVFVRDLLGDRRIALYSLILYLFLPAKLFFFPLLNAVTPVVVLACACVLLRWVMTARPIYAALLGVALYALVLYDPLALVMGLLFVALIARALWEGTLSWRTLCVQGGAGVVAFLVTYLGVYGGFGFDLFGAFGQIIEHTRVFNAEAGRPYSIWVRENLREFLFGIGICQAVLIFGVLGERLGRGGPLHVRLAQPIVVLCVGALCVLIVSDLMGSIRGEVIRLWIFLACFFQIPTAWACVRLESRVAMAVVLATTITQGALGTAMIGFIVP